MYLYAPIFHSFGTSCILDNNINTYIFLRRNCDWNSDFDCRILWTLFVMISVSLFSVQVIERSKAYFKYDTNVNVELIYVNETWFPAVTICNQNTYRYANPPMIRTGSHMCD